MDTPGKMKGVMDKNREKDILESPWGNGLVDKPDQTPRPGKPYSGPSRTYDGIDPDLIPKAEAAKKFLLGLRNDDLEAEVRMNRDYRKKGVKLKPTKADQLYEMYERALAVPTGGDTVTQADLAELIDLASRAQAAMQPEGAVVKYKTGK